MVRYTIIFSKEANKDKQLLKAAGLDAKACAILDSLSEDPFYFPPPYEALVGDLAGFYSRKINIKHRLVYEVKEETKTVKVLRMWTHYDWKK